MATTLSLAPLFRHSVGFDRFNDLFESALRSEAGTTYPPHNVEKHGDDHYRIVIAAAGLVEDDLEIQVEKGVLTVAGGKREHNEGITYLHQGIARACVPPVVPPGRPHRSAGRTAFQWFTEHRSAQGRTRGSQAQTHCDWWCCQG